MESIKLFSINAVWGNFSFDHAISSSIGNSEGILCVWEPNLFIKENIIAYDYFLAIMGTWIPTSTRLLIISVYAPQELTEKWQLWEYLSSLINRWYEECVILGNFNEVRTEQERSLEDWEVSSLQYMQRGDTAVVSLLGWGYNGGGEDFQDSPDDEEDTRSSHESTNDLKEEYQARDLLAKSKIFFKKGTQRFSSAKATDQTECHKCGKKELRPTKDFEAKYNKVKAKLALLSLSASASKASTVKNKGLIAEAYEWDEEEVSSDDNEMVEVKVLITLAEENDAVSKEGPKNGEWVKISMRKLKDDNMLLLQSGYSSLKA
ncbi:retrovirus-related pol polyprotein from transposon TNT 1-94 [Tanacetum coccineum]